MWKVETDGTLHMVTTCFKAVVLKVWSRIARDSARPDQYVRKILFLFPLYVASKRCFIGNFNCCKNLFMFSKFITLFLKELVR